MASERDSLQDRIEDRRRELDVDALLVQAPADLRWATGFTGSNGLLLWTASARHFLTDGRYEEQAAMEVRGAEVHVPGYDLPGYLAERGLMAGLRQVAIDSAVLTVASHQRLKELFPTVSWVAEPGLFSKARAAKTEDEIEAVRRAQRITEHVLEQVVQDLRPGVSEREVAAELTVRCLRGGADAMAFDPIVAVAERSALPHATPTDRTVDPGDPVLLDFGCVVNGYASDMSRMVSLGAPSEALRRIHSIVVSAMEAAEEVLRGGVPARDVDRAARDVIDRAGYADRFPHSLGHGVGLSVHEYPTVSWRNAEPMPEGCIVTLEPGIYLPGAFGVRVEDLVLVLADGRERLTAIDRDLIIL